MVSRTSKVSLILLSFCILSAFAPILPVRAATTYTVNKEWARIWINKDGSVDIQYNITLTYTSGSPQGIVTVGMPKQGFIVQYAQDLSGNALGFRDVSGGGFYGIDVSLKTPIILNRPNIFIVYVVVPGVVSKDQSNPGNAGMQFYPSTFDDASGSVGNVRVAIVLPQGVSSGEVRYPTGMPFDSVFMDGNNLVVYWERNNWSPSQELLVGVSFPDKYVNLGPDIWYYITIIGAIAIAIGAAVVVVLMLWGQIKKEAYEKPRIAVEALGAAQGLTSVEAAVVLNSKPVRVLTMILFGLLLKRLIMLTETDPLIKIKKVERSADEPVPPLRYYEIDYLKALKPDGSLDDMILAQTYIDLTTTVDHKIRGYSRADTVNYYRSVVNKAWEQVSQAGTPELKGDAIDQNIEWLLADERFNDKFRDAFPPGVIIYPHPGWWWYWHGPWSAPSTTPGQVGPVPGQEFANNIVRSLETASNNLVKNIQDFANRLVPAQSVQASERSVRSKSSCVCACAHCACACACVSCACACAHGGAR